MRKSRNNAIIGVVFSIGFLISSVHATTVVTQVYADSANSYQNMLGAFPSLGRLDRVRIQARIFGNDGGQVDDTGMPFGTYSQQVQAFVKLANFNFGLNLPSQNQIGPGNSPGEVSANQTIDYMISFNLTSKDYDLSSFYLSQDQISNGQYLRSNLDVYSDYIYYGNADFSLGGTVSYDYDLTPAELVAAGIVPEPATWAMMLIGFGMIGFAARKRLSIATNVTYT